MSDVSGLAHEYASASELSAALNRSLVTLKKQQLSLPGAENISAEEARRSRQTLAAIVQIVTLLLSAANEAEAAESSLESADRIPPSFVSRLREDWRGALPWHLQDLETIRQRLVHSEHVALTPEDFARLDELARVAEAESSKVFRLMMRTT